MRRAASPPPYEARRRAWECAYVLDGDFAAVIPPGARPEIKRAFGLGWERLGWLQVCFLFVVYGAVVMARP